MKRISMIGVVIVAMALMALPADAVKKEKKKQQPTPEQIAADSLNTLTQKAKNGDANAQNTLGVWYFTGKNVQKNQERALKYWALSAQQGNVEAIGNMAMCYQQGKGTKQDSAMAFKLYEKAIEKGNTAILKQHTELAEKQNNLFSNLLLHDIYNQGIGVKIEQAKAHAYLKKAASLGHTDSQVKWALLCLNDKNTAEAAKWFKKAADKGNLSAIYYYGYQLFKGMGVKQDKADGINYLQQASKRGLVEADNMLGKIYYEGDGTEKDLDKAIKHLKKAAVAKKADSQLLLGTCYKNGEGVEKDYDLATQWLAEAFNRQKAKEVRDLLEGGTDVNYKNYVDGLKEFYVNKNYSDATKLFKKIEKAGISEGITMQGVCLANPDNPKKNEKKAVKLLTDAAENSAAAKYQLAQLYENGTGVDKNINKARELIIQAAEKGYGYALNKAGDIFFEGKGVAQDYVKAVEYYLQAEALSKLTSTSARNLIKCYNMGISNIPDLNKKEDRIQALGKVSSIDNVLDMLRKL